jgi:predicted membrane-bound spermidine synthase
MVELGDRRELDRATFAAYLDGRQAPRLSWSQILIPWIVSLGLIAFQVRLIAGAVHAL